MEAEKRLLNEITQSFMPKDILKLTNKLFGLCQGLTTKQKLGKVSPSKMTIDVLKKLLSERSIENESLMAILNAELVSGYDQM